jgi:branched-chain amino acid transport system permease protein
MRFLFKTRYEHDIRLFKHGGAVFWYGLLLAALLLAPWLLDSYYVGQLTQVMIFALAGLGLMVLTGYTGLVSLGHAAFFGIGAYTEAVLLERGLPFPLPLLAAAGVAAGAGVLIGRPTLRLAGLYLAIATFAFALIVEEVLARWESVTRGNNGLPVPASRLAGLDLSQGRPFYYLTAAVLVLVVLGLLNLLRSPTGRALIAIRDSEIAAQSMGVRLSRYKTTAFALSAGITGCAGALFAHKLGFLSPESFTVLQSLELLVLVVVGGLGSLHGAIYGALFVVALPQGIAIARDHLPDAITSQPGLEPLLFGLILILFILFEPYGIYGRWLKVKFYFQLFPVYKRATFKRQKTYTRSERLR